MRRPLWIGLVALIPACVPSDVPDPGREAEAPNTRVLAIAEDGSRSEAREALTPEVLAGQYYEGDGLGHNLNLELRTDGSFESSLHGCLGMLGTTAGRWALGPDGVTVTITRADGKFQSEPLGGMRVVTLRGHYLLVQESFLDLFEKLGPERRTCLHQEAAKPALQAEMTRHIEDAVRRRE
ncbi:MAG TPA: hypothetical protein VKE40_17930 [Gemmataceae bacterium]|nr:hypothetical protein [Gemmataceae bacterium]